MSDALQIHEELCPRDTQDRKIVLSTDGVQECHSNMVSIDVFSFKHQGCRNVYPIKLIRPLHKYRISYRPHLEAILNDLSDCHCILEALIADNPKRAMIREALNHASSYACEYCTSKAVQYTETDMKIEEEKKN